jgi:hypothetical protein
MSEMLLFQLDPVGKYFIFAFSIFIALVLGLMLKYYNDNYGL